MLTDIIVVAVILLIIGGAVAYIIKEKKRGNKCIGCPHGKSCPSKGGCQCGCDKDA